MVQPVIVRIHVLSRCNGGGEHHWASLAVEGDGVIIVVRPTSALGRGRITRCPMIKCIQVLFCCVLADKFSVACLTFKHCLDRVVEDLLGRAKVADSWEASFEAIRRLKLSKSLARIVCTLGLAVV